MQIGIPKEIKDHETRVGASPLGVAELAHHGHKILVEKNAGAAIGYTDKDYLKAGAKIAKNAAELYKNSKLIIKVKEPQESEVKLIRSEQIIFSYLHLAAEKKLTKALIKSNCIAIAFETVENEQGQLPLLSPMSEVAGRLAVQAGAAYLLKHNGGRGLLIGGVPGVEAVNTVIIGGGVVGINAAQIAHGMGSKVYILDNSLDRLRYLNQLFDQKIHTIFSSQQNLQHYSKKADLLIGAVLLPGATAPKLVSQKMVAKMKPKSVIVDVAIDQGGCIETSRPTSHSRPTFSKENVIHYCVTNMPAAAAKTATRALENATLPYSIALANSGYEAAFAKDQNFAKGLNICKGEITYPALLS
jgi:alanine dehydrogenase